MIGDPVVILPAQRASNTTLPNDTWLHSLMRYA